MYKCALFQFFKFKAFEITWTDEVLGRMQKFLKIML